jgi:hypothetical protein
MVACMEDEALRPDSGNRAKLRNLARKVESGADDLGPASRNNLSERKRRINGL